MTMTISELEGFKNSMAFLAQLRAIPLELIEFYLENESGYFVRESDQDEEKPIIIQPPSSPNKP